MLVALICVLVRLIGVSLLLSYTTLSTFISSHWKGSIAFHQAHFGQGAGPILIGNVHCSGEESSLLECNRNMSGLFSCSHFNDAGVQCQGIH